MELRLRVRSSAGDPTGVDLALLVEPDHTVGELRRAVDQWPGLRPGVALVLEARVEEIRRGRSFLERNVGDRTLGDDSDEQVPMPAPVPVPRPPSFLPTASEWRY